MQATSKISKNVASKAIVVICLMVTNIAIILIPSNWFVVRNELTQLILQKTLT